MKELGKTKLLNRVKLLFMGILATVILAGCDNSQYIVLNPKGPVAQTELNLIIISVILCAIVVIPVLALLVYIVWRYRDKPGNTAPYQPNWHDSKTLEIIWWGIPIVIIGVLGYFTVRDTFALTKPPVSDNKPITIQVTSLDWKWLFQYPDQKVASVNYVEIPAGVPVQFVLTSDAPMNSFWVPQLGGQEYTMPGMAMRLWLQADKPGEYFGSGANFTGAGFAHMQFKVVAKPQAEFEKWVDDVKKSSPALTKEGYADLVKPGTSEVQTFSSFPEGLFNEVVNKNGGIYMHHNGLNMDHSGSSNENMPGMSSSSMPSMDMGHQ
ncbi:ubiquinol oxidase subunit II [Brevibacillus ginsengisoli]|uniref:ubiquinol oxidase subunit II n=1 Tax=Brevibacillus ginsengisoli TaxID=363854 RepID=UPI003CE8735D